MAAGSSPVKIIIIVVCLVAAGALVALTLVGGGSSVAGAADITYYDIGTGDLFYQSVGAGKMAPLPPVAAPSGATFEDGSPGGALAVMATCGKCNREESFPLYLQYFPADAMENLKGRPPTAAQPQMSLMAAHADSPDALEWFQYSDGEMLSLVNDAKAKCSGGAFKICDDR